MSLSLYEEKTNRARQIDALTLEQLDGLREKLIVRLRNEAPEALDDIRGHAARVGAVIRELIDKNMSHLSHQDARAVQSNLLNDIYGWGPISPLMTDDLVTDIWIFRWNYIQFEKEGSIHDWPHVFLSEEHLRRMAVRMAASVGRKVDEGHPLEDCRLPGGERVSISLSAVSLGGTTITIRRFGKFFELEDLSDKGMFPKEWIPVFDEMVRARKNIFLTGGFGCGKNTLMNALLARIPDRENLVIIEDPAESNLLYTVLHGPPDVRKRLPKAVRHFEPRHSNIEGAGEVTLDQIFRATLKMKPTRVAVGEVTNWQTAYFALSAMNLGQPGSMTTGHANSSLEGLVKLDNHLISYPGGVYANPEARANLIAGIDRVIYLEQKDGHRFVKEIAQVVQARRGEFPGVAPVCKGRCA